MPSNTLMFRFLVPEVGIEEVSYVFPIVVVGLILYLIYSVVLATV